MDWGQFTHHSGVGVGGTSSATDLPNNCSRKVLFPSLSSTRTYLILINFHLMNGHWQIAQLLQA